MLENKIENNLINDFKSNQNLNNPTSIKRILIKQQHKFLVGSYCILLITILMLGVTLGLWASKRVINSINYQTNENKYTSFLLEVYDQIKENYWDKITDEQLTNLYKLGAEKLSGQPQTMASSGRVELKALLDNLWTNYDEAKQQEVAVNLADVVLANLTPNSRSRLYSSDKQQELRNKVNSTDPTTNLYSILGVDKNASQDQITKVYQDKIAALTKDTSPEGQEKLSSTKRAFQTIGDPLARTTYDKSGAEPTIVYKIYEPDILYLQIKQIAPTTVDEFKQRLDETNNNKLSTLIIDLRGNIGGNIDTLPYLLGFFIGPNQYAYDYFYQGQSDPHKTVTDKLATLTKFRKIVVLTDKATQSTSEVLAATLKKYNVAILLGTTTGGRGTVENFFPIKTKINDTTNYSSLIVKAVTLRDDNQPIEGRGVEPNISTNSKDWPNKITGYFNYEPLTKVLQTLIK